MSQSYRLFTAAGAVITANRRRVRPAGEGTQGHFRFDRVDERNEFFAFDFTPRRHVILNGSEEEQNVVANRLGFFPIWGGEKRKEEILCLLIKLSMRSGIVAFGFDFQFSLLRAASIFKLRVLWIAWHVTRDGEDALKLKCI